MSTLKTLTRLKNIKPYLLILHSKSHQSAVYNRKYVKMFEAASPQLINYAIHNHTQSSTGFKLTSPEQQPSWISSDMKDKCVCYFLYNDGSDIVNLRKIPEG